MSDHTVVAVSAPWPPSEGLHLPLLGEGVAGAQCGRATTTLMESQRVTPLDRLLDLLFLVVATDPKVSIYWYLISRQRLSNGL
jgi:hypothetical protein